MCVAPTTDTTCLGLLHQIERWNVERVPHGYRRENDLSATEHFMTNQFIETNEKPHSHGDTSEH